MRSFSRCLLNSPLATISFSTKFPRGKICSWMNITREERLAVPLLHAIKFKEHSWVFLITKIVKGNRDLGLEGALPRAFAEISNRECIYVMIVYIFIRWSCQLKFFAGGVSLNTSDRLQPRGGCRGTFDNIYSFQRLPVV